MAKREWFPQQRNWMEKNRNMIVYVLALLGILGCLVGLTQLPDMVSINPNVPDVITRPRELMVGMHFGIIALFTLLFWKWPREIAYLAGAVFGVVMLYFMLYANLGA